MGTRERPRKRLRSWLRLDDEQQRPKRRRSTARRDQSPPEVTDEDIVRGVWGDEWIDEHGVRQGGRDGIGWQKLGGY